MSYKKSNKNITKVPASEAIHDSPTNNFIKGTSIMKKSIALIAHMILQTTRRSTAFD
jgi:hypothetical protein